MNIAPPTPMESWQRLGKMRELFRHMRDERITHPAISIETREVVGAYYGDMMEAIDVAMVALVKLHHLKIEPAATEAA